MPTELSWHPPDSFVVSAAWPFDLGTGHHDHLDPILLDSGILPHFEGFLQDYMI